MFELLIFKKIAKYIYCTWYLAYFSARWAYNFIQHRSFYLRLVCASKFSAEIHSSC